MEKLLAAVLDKSLAPIVALLTEISAKLNPQLVVAPAAPAPTPQANASTPPTTVVAAPTRADIGNAMLALAQANMPAAEAIMKQFGASVLNDIAPEKYPALLIAIQATAAPKAVAAKDLL